MSLSAVTATLPVAPGGRDPVDDLLRNPTVQSARRVIRALEPQTIDTQVMLCEIPAPPFAEARRGEAIRHLFEDAGLTRVHIDAAGNVLGERPGRSSSPSVVLSAHLDTVFPQGTDVGVRRVATMLRGPGISDDCRGLAVLVAVARALKATGVETARSLTFVATVGEEALGNLRGVRHLFEVELRGRIGRFLSIDGAGMSLVSRGVGSRRFRITFSGTGGHSYGSFGIANPIHALGRTLDAIARMPVPSESKATFNVGRIGGGTSVNTIASEAWMEVDLRASTGETLKRLETQMRAAVASGVATENRRWGGRDPVSAVIQLVGERPAGATDEDDPLVRNARRVSEALGANVSTTASSTDSNFPMSLGIPAITFGGGGEGSGEHSVNETFETKGSELGSERALLIALAASSTDR